MSTFPQQVLEQAKYDARIGGQSGQRTAFQRAQDFLRNKLNPAINPATATPQQQTEIDARNAKRAIQELEKAKNVKQLQQVGPTAMALMAQSPIGLLLATGGSTPIWQRKGFATRAEYEKAIASQQSDKAAETIKNRMIEEAGGIEKYKKLYPAAAEGGYSISPRVRQELAEERANPKVETEAPPPVPTAPVYNAEEQVKKHGVKKAEDLAMMEWAKAHKGLAEKVKPGQAGYDAIQLALGKTTVEPEDIRAFMDDSGKSAEEARAILGGGSVETVIDGDNPMVTTINQPNNQKGAEAFKNFAIGALQGLDIGKYKDLGYNPFQIDAGKLLDQSVDFNIPGLERPLGDYGIADYANLLKDSHIIYN